MDLEQLLESKINKTEQNVINTESKYIRLKSIQNVSAGSSLMAIPFMLFTKNISSLLIFASSFGIYHTLSHFTSKFLDKTTDYKNALISLKRIQSEYQYSKNSYLTPQMVRDYRQRFESILPFD